MGYLGSIFGLGAGAALAGWVLGRPRRPSSPTGFMDLLPWGVGVVFEGRVVIVNKDGTLSSCFLIEGPDFGTSTAETLERLSRVVNSVLVGLAGEYVVHVDAIRRRASGYPTEGAFPDGLTAFLDQLRREDYESEVRRAFHHGDGTHRHADSFPRDLHARSSAVRAGIRGPALGLGEVRPGFQ